MKNILVLHALTLDQQPGLANFVRGFATPALHNVAVSYRNIWRPVLEAQPAYDALFVGEDIWQLRFTEDWDAIVDVLTTVRKSAASGYGFIFDDAPADAALGAVLESLELNVITSPRVPDDAFATQTLNSVRQHGSASDQVPQPSAAVDRLQWRLTPHLFGALQYLAQRAKDAGALPDLIDLAFSLNLFGSLAPSNIENLDLRLVQDQITDVHFPSELGTLKATVVDVLREVMLTGALTDALVWLQTIDDGLVADYQLRGWVSFDQTLLSKPVTGDP